MLRGLVIAAAIACGLWAAAPAGADSTFSRHNALARGAREYKRLSRIPSVKIVDRKTVYSHLDPLAAAPASNDFLKTVVPWLKRVLRGS